MIASGSVSEGFTNSGRKKKTLAVLLTGLETSRLYESTVYDN